MSLTDIKSLDISELTELMLLKGQKKFRAEQVFSWLHQKHIDRFDDMSNLPKSLLEELSSICYISVANIEK
ncbi:MAG: 23S rRNA (adenine(2503)-C(2))-methyltransferase RlmN, partial [Ruminococcaceae bacterium]|nr:23S rRNA (adenine(2503)-C(2))-methyltransferase RlmN [Oscillospiraceae bacterium]